MTNALNWDNFKGEVYKVNITDDLSLVTRYRQVVLAAYHEGILEQADIIITGGMTATLLSYVLSVEYSTNLRERPIVYISPKVPEKSVTEFSVEGKEERLFWWLVGNMSNIHAIVLDNDREYELASERLFESAPYTGKSIERLILWKYNGATEVPGKKDKVVWSGRLNPIKRPDIGARIFSLLRGRDVEVEFFFPAVAPSRRRFLSALKQDFQVYLNLETTEYRREAGSAKVLLITSEVEGQPLGYLELLEMDVIPVIRKRPWMKTFLTEKWPLVFTSEGESVEMCIDVMQNYTKYVDLLHDCLGERYNKEPNFAQLIEQIWSDYVAGDYRHDYSVANRGRKVR
ncbi:hypothetical protein [Pseudothermotoga sp.]|uniref:hypothetical protein n=1 Tax=Pseudothermotoga sp. TaxID=2033661 RepID=UPI0025795058|nr:hypothetical protein [Pseudothermotoga sp.]